MKNSFPSKSFSGSKHALVMKSMIKSYYGEISLWKRLDLSPLIKGLLENFLYDVFLKYYKEKKLGKIFQIVNQI